MTPTSHTTQLCCQYIRGQRERMGYLGSLQISGRALARPAILHDLVLDLLAFSESLHACTLYSGDVDEDVRTAVIRLNEAETLGVVKPLNGTDVHNDFLSKNRCGSRGALRD